MTSAVTPPAPSPSRFERVVRNFAPTWFAAVMGTGALAIASGHYAQTYPLLAPFSRLVHGLNVALFLLLLVPWTLRWLRHRQAAMATLRHPVMGQFYATFAIALLVLAAEALLYGHDVALAALLWGIGVAMTWLFSLAAFWVLFFGEQASLEHVTPGMFIPPVGLVVVPLAGHTLAGHAEGVLRELVWLLNMTSLGAGMFLWLGLLALTVHRFVLGKPLPGALLPTVWINLGPIGVIVIDLLGLAQGTPFSGPREVLPLFAFLLWGFGLWWPLMATLLTLAYWRRNQLPFSLAWWAFTFPLGAFATASHRLGTLFGFDTVWTVGLVALALLVLLWTLALINSLRGAFTGALFADGPAPTADASSHPGR